MLQLNSQITLTYHLTIMLNACAKTATHFEGAEYREKGAYIVPPDSQKALLRFSIHCFRSHSLVGNQH